MLYKCLLKLCEDRRLEDEEHFSVTVKAHLERGAVLLQNEHKYAGNDGGTLRDGGWDE